MSRDGQGVYNLPPGNPVVTESVISSTTHNTTMADVASALSQSISKDGQTAYTSNQSMGGYKLTQVANASARDQYASAGQVQDGSLTLIGSVSGADTITGSVSPAITAYASGVPLTLIPFANNTGPATLALNGLAARAVVKFNSVPLVSGDLLAGIPATVTFNGTSFYLSNPQVVASDVARLSQPNNFTSNNTFSVAGTATAPTIKLSSSFPLKEMRNTSAPANAGSWIEYVDASGNYVLRVDSDDHTSSSQVVGIIRSGTTATQYNINATTINLNGVSAADYPRLSQGNVFQQELAIGKQSNFGYLRAVGSSSSTIPGYVEFYTGDNVRHGYMGFLNGTNRMAIVAEGGWTWDFVPAPSVNGVTVTSAALFTSGSLQNSVVAQSNVTQHQTALALTANQVTADVSPISSSTPVNPTHNGNVLIVDNASTVTLTVGNNALGGTGKAAVYVRRNTGAVTFLASGTTIRSPGGGLSITIQHGKVALIQVSATEFELSGNL